MTRTSGVVPTKLGISLNNLMVIAVLILDSYKPESKLKSTNHAVGLGKFSRLKWLAETTRIDNSRNLLSQRWRAAAISDHMAGEEMDMCKQR